MFLIAHRANNNHNFSENSMNAIVSCVECDYIDGIEIDVRITKDKQLVLIHDPIIDFSSNGHGIVKYMNLTELARHEYGKSREQLTLLEDVFKIIGNKILLVELKISGNDYIDIVDETVRLFNRYSSVNLYICSFNFGLLIYLKNNYRSIRCGLIIGYGLNKFKYINNFDFLVLSSKNLDLLNRKKYNFIFGIKENQLGTNLKNIYLITDKSYKFLNKK